MSVITVMLRMGERSYRRLMALAQDLGFTSETWEQDVCEEGLKQLADVRAQRKKGYQLFLGREGSGGEVKVQEAVSLSYLETGTE